MNSNNEIQMQNARHRIQESAQQLSTYQYAQGNLNGRRVPNVPQPIPYTPTDKQLFVTDQRGIERPNAEFMKQHFLQEGRLTESQAIYILEQATELLSREPNLVDVESPVTICGDIHGQYYDLMKLFEVGGDIRNDNSYLFLGDYVDRGCFGIECLLYLYTLKLWYPTKLTLLRGNHECEHLTSYFTFKRECLHKYSIDVYDACIRSFRALPVTALVDGRFFCVHGGISPELITLEDLHRLDRFREPGSHGLLCDLLWADPIVNYGHEYENSTHGPALQPGTMWQLNATRGCSYFFTYEAACKFLERNGLLGIIRGHEAQDAGYTMHRKTPTKKFPSVITIFSAPNYLDVYHNRGAVLKYANKNITIRQYNSSSHPYWLPNFMDAFTWSLPFVGAKIAEMLLAVLAVCSEEELESASEDDDDERAAAGLTPEEIAQRRQQIKNKILAVGKMQRVFQLLREEAENASELSTATDVSAPRPSDSIGVGANALSVQGTQIRHQIHSFADARRSDLLNERIPEPSSSTESSFPLVPVPSMRRGSNDSNIDMEVLIRRALEEEEDGTGGVVEMLAEKIARGRRVTGRPRALKRFETA